MRGRDRLEIKDACACARDNVVLAIDRLGYDNGVHAILIAHRADLLSVCDEYRHSAERTKEIAQ